MDLLKRSCNDIGTCHPHRWSDTRLSSTAHITHRRDTSSTFLCDVCPITCYDFKRVRYSHQIVLTHHYLSRPSPFTTTKTARKIITIICQLFCVARMNQFDKPDRLFDSLATAWVSVCKNGTDVKELIPEFYHSSGDFLLNNDRLDLGIKSDGTSAYVSFFWFLLSSFFFLFLLL